MLVAQSRTTRSRPRAPCAPVYRERGSPSSPAVGVSLADPDCDRKVCLLVREALVSRS